MLKQTLCAALLCQTAGIALACDLPPLVVIPSKEEAAARLEELRASMQTYHQAMVVYTECLKADFEAAGGESAHPITKAVIGRRSQTAVAEVQAVLQLYAQNVEALAQSGPPAGPAPAGN